MKKYKLTRNPLLKIIAFCCAVVLWLIVANVDNPITSATYSGISVQITNDSVITQEGNTYEVVDEQEISVVVYAKRSIIQKLTSDDIVATADLSDLLDNTGLVPIEISIPKYSGSYQSAEAVPRNIQISIEASAKDTFQIVVSTTGTPRDGYVVGSTSVDPVNVTITGAESTIEKIYRVAAEVNVDGISADKTLTADLVIYDEDGNEISQGQLSNNLGDEGIQVDVEVLATKTVSLNFDASGTPAAGYEYVGCTSEPETIQICGDKDTVEAIDVIDIPAEAISVAGASENVVKTIDITQYLPDGIELVEGASSESVTVTANIDEEGTRTITYLVSSVRMSNLADGLTVSFDSAAEISFVFRGDQDILDSLVLTNEEVSVDLSDYTEAGTYDVPVIVELPTGYEDVTLEKEVTVQLTLEEEEDTEESDEEASSAEETADTGEES